MNIDRTNGALEVDDLYLDANVSINSIESLKEKYNIRMNNMGNDYVIYNIINLEDKEINISLIFLKEMLKSISISLAEKYNFPSFLITEEEEKKLKEKLYHIGGEGIYSWGSIGFEQDRRAGLASILVKYDV